MPSVDILKGFYEFSLALGVIFTCACIDVFLFLTPRTEKSLKVLLQNLCTDALLEADLSESQALTKQLALVFDFVLRFDDLKVLHCVCLFAVCTEKR